MCYLQKSIFISKCSFYYTDEKDGIKKEKRVTAEFWADHLVFEIINNDITNEIDVDRVAVEDTVKMYIESNINKDYRIISYEFTNFNYRQINGIPYVFVNTTVKFSLTNDMTNQEYNCSLEFAIQL